MRRQDAPIGDALQALFPFLGAMTTDGRARALAQLQPLHLKPRQLYLDEGQSCRQLALLEQGELRVFKTSATGRQITLYRVHPGRCCILSVTGVLANAPYPAQVEATKPSVLHTLSAESFRALFDAEPAVRAMVVSVTNELLSGLMTLVAEVAFRKMDERMAGLLLEAAGRPMQTTHEQLAAHLGTAREVVSRLLENFRDDGLIRIERGAIEVLDVAGLRRVRDDIAR